MSEIVVFFLFINSYKTQDKRGEWDSNPRVLSNMGLAIPRPTGLGDPRPTAVKVKDSIGLY